MKEDDQSPLNVDGPLISVIGLTARSCICRHRQRDQFKQSLGSPDRLNT